MDEWVECDTTVASEQTSEFVFRVVSLSLLRDYTEMIISRLFQLFSVISNIICQILN